MTNHHLAYQQRTLAVWLALGKNGYLTNVANNNYSL